MLEEVRAGGLLPAGTPVVAMLSGGRDSVCLLDLAVRAARRRARSPRCTSTTACATTPARTSATAPSSASGSGCGLEVERPRRPEGPGNLQAWARDARYAAAARLALPRGRDDRHRPHRRRPGRDDPLPARLLAEPPRAARHAPPRRAAGAAAARLHPGRDDRLLRGAGARLARRRDQRRARPTRATGSATACCRSWRRSTRPPPANVLRTAALLRDEAEVLDALVAAELDGSGGSPRRHDRARAPRRAAPGAAPPRRPAARRPRRRPAGRRRRPPRRGGRRPAPHRHRDARPRRRRPRRRRGRRPARRAPA